MTEANPGIEALDQVCATLGVETTWTAAPPGYCWSLEGAPQRAWAEYATGTDGWPTWRLQLRTPAIDGFSGSTAALQALSDTVNGTTLAGLVRHPGDPSRLELATSLDVHEATLDWAVRVIAVAARVQAAEAVSLRSQADGLADAGLVPAVGADAPAALGLLSAVLLGCERPEAVPRWAEPEIARFFDALEETADTRVTGTAWGISAMLDHRRGTTKARSVLEVKVDAWHPSLGDGLSIALWTPTEGALLDAIAWNEHEAGAHHLGLGLGGWWAPQDGALVHQSFLPRLLYERGAATRLLHAYTLRARRVAAGWSNGE